MPVPLILCRLKDDHSTTQMIGETALVYFPQWEPVPDDEDTPEASGPQAVEPPEDEPDPNESEPEPESDEDKPVAKAQPKTSRTTRTKAATSAEKDKE